MAFNPLVGTAIQTGVGLLQGLLGQAASAREQRRQREFEKQQQGFQRQQEIQAQLAAEEQAALARIAQGIGQSLIFR